MKQAVPTAKPGAPATIRALGTKPISTVKASKYGAFSAVATFLITFIISVTNPICLFQRQLQPPQQPVNGNSEKMPS
jgi:hypothetical protein